VGLKLSDESKSFCVGKNNMKSKTLIEKQLEKKSNSILVKTIISAKKNKSWFKVAELLSTPRRKRMNVNLSEISKKAKEGEIVVVSGKVLSGGEVDKKIKVVALNFSADAREKLLKSKSEVSSILDEIKKNPGAKGIKILK